MESAKLNHPLQKLEMKRRWKLPKESEMTGDIFRMGKKRQRLKHWSLKQTESNKCINSMTIAGIKGQGQAEDSCRPEKQKQPKIS